MVVTTTPSPGCIPRAAPPEPRTPLTRSEVRAPRLKHDRARISMAWRWHRSCEKLDPMKRNAGICVVLALSLGACGVGDEGGDDGGDDQPPLNEVNPNHLKCTATFQVTSGSFQMSPTPAW